MAQYHLLLSSFVVTEDSLIPTETQFSFDQTENDNSWGTTTTWEFSMTQKYVKNYFLNIWSNAGLWDHPPSRGLFVVGKVLEDEVELNYTIDTEEIKHHTRSEFDGVLIQDENIHILYKVLDDEVSIEDSTADLDVYVDIEEVLDLSDDLYKFITRFDSDILNPIDNRVFNFNKRGFKELLDYVDGFNFGITLILHEENEVNDHFYKLSNKFLSSPVELEDLFIRSGDNNITRSDSTNIDDEVYKTISLILEDSVTILDSRKFNFNKRDLKEQLDYLDNFNFGASLIIHEENEINDTYNVSLDRDIVKVDSIGFSDNSSLSIIKILEDSIEINDSGEDLDVFINIDDDFDIITDIHLNLILKIEDSFELSETLNKIINAKNTDIVEFIDLPIVNKDKVYSNNDTITIVDDGEDLDIYLNISDNIDFIDNITNNNLISKSDSVDIVGLNRFFTFRGVDDTIEIIDSIIGKYIIKSNLDNAVFIDNNFNKFNIGFQDNFSFIEFLYKLSEKHLSSDYSLVDDLFKGRFLNLQDSINLNDILTKHPNINLNDNYSVNDNFLFIIGKILNDFVHINDDYDIEGLKFISRLFEDIANIEDNISILNSYIRSLNDNTTTQDIIIKTTSLYPEDDLELEDDPIKNKSFNLYDEYEILDSIIKTNIKPIEDIIEVDDSGEESDIKITILNEFDIIDSKKQDIELDIETNIEYIDSINSDKHIIIEDSISIVDIIYNEFLIKFSDSISIEEDYTKLILLINTSILELISSIEVGQGDNLEIAEQQSIVDNINIISNYIKNNTDDIDIIDDVVKSLNLSLADSISLNDIISKDIILKHYFEIYPNDSIIKIVDIDFEDNIEVEDLYDDDHYSNYVIEEENLITIVDQISKTLDRDYEDVVEIVDNISIISPRLIEEEIGVSDEIVLEINNLIYDEVVINDDLIKDVVKPINEIVQIVDEYSIIEEGKILITRNDYIYIEDDFELIHSINFEQEDVINIEDDISISIGYHIELEDGISLVDDNIKRFDIIFNDRFFIIDEMDYDREAAIITDDDINCEDDIEHCYSKIEENLIEIVDELTKNFCIFIDDSIYCHGDVLMPQEDIDVDGACQGINEILTPIPEVGMENEMTMKLTEFHSRTKKDVECLIRQFFNEEDIKGKSAIQYRIYQYHILFQLVATMWLEMKWNLESWEYFKSKYGIDNARKLAACYHIDFDMILDIFDINKNAKYQTNIYLYDLTKKDKYKYNLREVNNICELINA